MEFLDLFLPINLSSASRARVFLWLMYHYLQGPDKPNPFDDDYSRANPPKVPRMRSLTREEQAQENVDPPDEVEWGKRMSAQRGKFLKELVDEMEADKRRKRNAQMVPPVSSSFSVSMYSGWREVSRSWLAGSRHHFRVLQGSLQREEAVVCNELSGLGPPRATSAEGRRIVMRHPLRNYSSLFLAMALCSSRKLRVSRLLYQGADNF